MKRFIADHSALLLLAALCVALGWYLPEFRMVDNLQIVALRAAMLGMVALGGLLVMITGGIDLSVGGVAALAGVAGCLSMLRVQTWLSSAWVHGWIIKLPHSMEPYLTNGLFPALVFASGIVVGILLGFGCGLVNGLLCAKGRRVRSIIITLCMMGAARGLVMVIPQQPPMSDPPKLFAWLGGPQAWWVPVAIACQLGGVFAVMLAYTQFGRNLYAVGGNAEGSRLSGIPVGRTRLKAFVLSGTVAGLAGMVLASGTGAASPDAAGLFELDAIAACVIGGASLAGGVGGAITVLVGALVLAMLYNFCSIKGLSPDWQKVLLGALLVSLVCYDNWRQRRAGIVKEQCGMSKLPCIQHGVHQKSRRLAAPEGPDNNSPG